MHLASSPDELSQVSVIKNISTPASQIKSQMLTRFSGWHTDWALNKPTVNFFASFLMTDNGQIFIRLVTFTERDTEPQAVRKELQTTSMVRKRLIAICLPARYFRNCFLRGQSDI
jgi:hypothetical protein